MTKRLYSILGIIGALAILAMPLLGNRVVNNPPDSPVSYVINQGFEGTGYDNSESWSELGPDVDPDYTTDPKVGAQSCFVGDTDEAYISIADSSTYTLEFWFKPLTALPGVTKTVAALRTAADGALCLVRITSSGAITVYANGSDSTATTATMSAGTWYRVRMQWVASGTCSVEFNTTGTFDGTGTDFTSKTGGAGTVGRLTIGNNGSTTDYVFDGVQLY